MHCQKFFQDESGVTAAQCTLWAALLAIAAVVCLAVFNSGGA